MAPGPKKKNFNKRGGDISQDNRQNLKTSQQPQIDDAKNSKIAAPISDKENTTENCLSNGKKYEKRSVVSNSGKYDEPVVDPHSDSLKGEDFEVLMSYSGTSSSQLQLQDEKEWEEESSSEKMIALDFKDLVLVLKCVPLHKRISLPEDVFDEAQIARFVSIAENSKSMYLSNSKLASNQEFIEKQVSEKTDVLDSSLNIIESCESDETYEISSNKLPVLDTKTESIIESLASCLSLKSSVKEAPESMTVKTENITDDLDFLLSLNVASNAVDVSKKIEPIKLKNETNVDDWLNSLLDD